MDKTPHTELHRLFIVEKLPDPLTTASAHLQIFDTYIPETRLRVRQMRDPATNNWTRLLQQRYSVDDGHIKLVEMHLDDDEFAIFERMRGAETRKNRYFHEFDGREVVFDVYLGALGGLTTAWAGFESIESMIDYDPPRFMLIEVTHEEGFDSRQLADHNFAYVQKELVRLMSDKLPVIPED